MSRIITFSRSFPAYHPKAGQPTWFVEKILNQLGVDYRKSAAYIELLMELNKKKLTSGKLTDFHIMDFISELNREITDKKVHTIRAGNSRKAGDWFQPAVWSDKPYHSPQINFAPVVQIRKVWGFEVDRILISVGDKMCVCGDDKLEIVEKVAANDGLSPNDFLHWFQFPKPFCGQVICWDENVEY